jgi:hypothetical protein
VTHQLQMLMEHTPPARARRTDPATSKDAAKVVNVEAKQQWILDRLALIGPATCSEIAGEWQPRDSIIPRMKPLEALGKIERTGERRKAPGSRVSQQVWGLVR